MDSPYFSGKQLWGIILGGSSGIGWGIAEKMAREGMHLLLVHRDRKATAAPFLEKVEGIRQTTGVAIFTFNSDALLAEERQKLVHQFKQQLFTQGKIKLFVHAISRGNLKSMAGQSKEETIEGLSEDYEQLYLKMKANQTLNNLLHSTDLTQTVHAMGLSMYEWVSDLHAAGLFDKDARVLGLTSEGSNKAWPSYAAVSAAKAALEAICRSIALEFAPFGIRCNVLQPGVTQTPSLQMIPGHEHLIANALMRNPFHRLTTPEDVANMAYLLCRDEASWVNGAIIPVDGGEKNS